MNAFSPPLPPVLRASALKHDIAGGILDEPVVLQPGRELLDDFTSTRMVECLYPSAYLHRIGETDLLTQKQGSSPYQQ